jgi:hypothetical protein
MLDDSRGRSSGVMSLAVCVGLQAFVGFELYKETATFNSLGRKTGESVYVEEFEEAYGVSSPVFSSACLGREYRCLRVHESTRVPQGCMRGGITRSRGGHGESGKV